MEMVSENNLHVVDYKPVLLTREIVVQDLSAQFIDQLISARLNEIPSISSVDEYTQLVESYARISYHQSYQDCLALFVECYKEHAMANAGTIDWRDVTLLFQLFQDKVDPLIDELVRYKSLQQFRMSVSENDADFILHHWSMKIFSEVEKVRDAEVSAYREDYQSELDLLLEESDRKAFLKEKHRFHFSKMKDIHNHLEDYKLWFDGWGVQEWRWFTTKYLFKTLCDTIAHSKPNDVEKQLEYEFDLCDQCLDDTASLCDFFGAQAVHYILVEWMKSQIEHEQQNDNELSHPKTERKRRVTHFDALFVNQENINKYVSLLRWPEHCVINNENHWIGGVDKYVIVTWFQALEASAKVLPNVSRRTLAKLLNDRFKGLDIDPSCFSKPAAKSFNILPIYEAAIKKVS